MTPEFVDVEEYIVQIVQNAYDAEDEDPEVMPCPDLEEVYDTIFNDMIDNIFDAVEEVFGDEGVTSSKLKFIGIDENGIPKLHLVKAILDHLGLPYTYKGQLYNTLQLRFFK